jgi:hypothetical protein
MSTDSVSLSSPVSSRREISNATARRAGVRSAQREMSANERVSFAGAKAGSGKKARCARVRTVQRLLRLLHRQRAVRGRRHGAAGLRKVHAAAKVRNRDACGAALRGRGRGRPRRGGANARVACTRRKSRARREQARERRSVLGASAAARQLIARALPSSSCCALLRASAAAAPPLARARLHFARRAAAARARAAASPAARGAHHPRTHAQSAVRCRDAVRI